MYQRLGLVLLILTAIPFVVFAVPSIVGASQSYVVLTSSMSPTIHAGDVVFVSNVDPESIDEGDVITFDPDRGPLAERGELITHRVVDIEQLSDGPHFETKGDANDSPDTYAVAAENVVGRVHFHLPMIGHVIAFAGSRLGMLLMVVLPASLLVITELRDLITGASDEESTTE
jgi:signal peptidase